MPGRSKWKTTALYGTERIRIMKKQMVWFALAAVSALVLLAGCAAPEHEASAQAVAATGANAAETYITEAAAKAAALKHAGLTEADVTFVHANLDRDDGRMEYEIEFYTADKEYDYDIDAVTGEVVSCDFDAEHGDRPVAANAGAAEAPGTQGEPDAATAATADAPAGADLSAVAVTEEEARAIALKDAGRTEADVTFVRVKLDRDDGRLEYEIEFYADGKEYDYDIDAATGKILSRDDDAEHYAPPKQDAQAGKEIGEAAAKEIALKDAGFAESEVSRLKIHLDRDDGRTVYDVEFHVGRMEYSYEIDAYSGEILEREADQDD